MKRAYKINFFMQKVNGDVYAIMENINDLYGDDVIICNGIYSWKATHNRLDELERIVMNDASVSAIQNVVDLMNRLERRYVNEYDPETNTSTYYITNIY